ncbi:MAG: hypothetical protein EOP00_35715 [Pedobacter sp.]|nr:MAG: hypothetical protein EOP00_35715 [Pedobacter sp.]
MKLSFLAPFIFASLLYNVANAQIEVEKSDTVGNKKVQVFSNDDYFNDNSRKTKNKNLVKLNPLLIGFGELPFYYERRIHPMFSVEAGIGPTISNELTLGLAYGENNINLFPDNIESQLGFTFKSGLRFYPNGKRDFPEGLYFSPELRYRVFKYGLLQGDNTGFETSIKDLKASDFDFVMLGGYQLESFLLDDLYVDYYFGVGIRNRRVEAVKSLGIDPNTNLESFTFALYKKQLPFISGGFKLGVSF